MALFTTSGMKLYIGGVVDEQADDFAASDFSGETWTEIDGWSQAGTYGDAAQTITTALINRGRDVKQKGTANAGSMENTFVWIPSDAGQLLLEGAASPADTNNYAFKIEYSDTVGNTTPTINYFIGIVTTFQQQGGDANTVRTVNAMVEINSNVVRVAAVPE